MGLGGGNKSAKKAEQVEAQRQADIKAGVANVNSVYDSADRKTQGQDFLAALRKQLTGDVTRQHGVAQRKLKFANAKSGVTGGSQDVDSNQTLQEDFSKGLVDAERKAQGSFASLLADDESSRLQLTGLVQNGLDTGTAAQRAAASLQGNLKKAQSDNQAQGTWDVFSNTANIWKTQTEAAEKRNALKASTGGLYAQNPWSP